MITNTVATEDKSGLIFYGRAVADTVSRKGTAKPRPANKCQHNAKTPRYKFLR